MNIKIHLINKKKLWFYNLEYNNLQDFADQLSIYGWITLYDTRNKEIAIATQNIVLIEEI